MSWRLVRGVQLAQPAVRQLSSKSAVRGKMFSKILIANRGEIACRIVRTARKLGVNTVAVFSDADANAMHVRMADEAIRIGSAPSSESYLKMQTILDVAKRTGAQAIHPGYGFLSENATFADMCEQQGIVFIGPPASAIRDMGSKSESKNIMTKAGVPLIRGYHGDDQSNERLQQEADRITYPVLIKAVLGGGGKGMRIVRSRADFLGDLESARQEAKRSFADTRVLIEKYVERPRHVEVQVFADTFGNTVHLYERDCSVQRRHQKIIEESPAPHLDEELRQHFGRTAVTAAKAVNYVGAGTVEFLMDTETNEYYFMEMNTRLQVEHPVTEMVTNTDLVEWQLLAASGFPLPVTQEQIKQRGHAFEARIYAENPAKNFIPGAGPLKYLRTPTPASDLRIETGIEQGDAVSVYYDPMISKLVVWAPDRRTALAKLDTALSEYNICGLHTNIDFLRDLATHPKFQDGLVSTKFIEENHAALFPVRHPLKNTRAVAQAVLSILIREQETKQNYPNKTTDPSSPWASSQAERINDSLSRMVTLATLEGETLTVRVAYGPDGVYTLSWPGEHVTVRGHVNAAGKLCAFVNDKYNAINVAVIGDHITLFAPEGSMEYVVPAPAFLKASEKGAGNRVVSPTTGTIEEVLVSTGAVVEKNQPVIKMESMKMMQVLRAPRAGVVKQVNFSKGDFVADSAVILELEPEEAK
eukprot:m.828569 g.828569  ORF g.828569 m.828569 type:complete len:701 (+) comp59439_c0_seq2:18-2120(+)